MARSLPASKKSGMDQRNNANQAMRRSTFERYVLRLGILDAEDLDPPSKYTDVTRRNYRVVTWINPNQQYCTNQAIGFPTVTWNRQLDIPVNNISLASLEDSCLCLEVVRAESNTDPGPSRGLVVVGRLKLPLPTEVGRREGGRFGLVRFVNGQTIGEGHIVVAMELMRN